MYCDCRLSIEAKPERKKKKCVFEELSMGVANTPNTIFQVRTLDYILLFMTWLFQYAPSSLGFC
jgi:hypothetical protein